MTSDAGPSSLPLPLPPPSPSSSSIPPKPSSSSDTDAPAPLCAICTSDSAKYTCPRCKLRTCSLSCSTKHKSIGAGCSGIRNKAAYIPMNQYGYMALMDDYTFLEEVGRKVSEAGKEIVQGGFQNSQQQQQSGNQSVNGRGRGRGRGRGGRGSFHGQTVVQHRAGNTSKRDVLRMELDFRDIEMDMLPVGMEKRTLNQSTWDSTCVVLRTFIPKSMLYLSFLSFFSMGNIYRLNTALMTVEFVFHAPPDPYAPSSQAPDPPVTILTHRNRLDETVAQCVQARIAERVKSKKEKQVPQWLQDLVVPDPSDPDSFQTPTCVMPTVLDPLASLQSRTTALRPGHIKRQGFYKLDFKDSLQTALKHKQFVEYPTIEVWEKDAFTGTLVDDGGSVMLEEADERKPKRRKLGAREGKKAITGLLGAYGSDEEEDGEDAREEKNVFDLLAGYAGSDDEEASEGAKPAAAVVPHYLDDDELGDEDAEGETDDEMGEEPNPEELAAMLQKLREAGALRDTSANSRLATTVLDEEEQVDWGDSDDDL
ncbi:hypothetical protein EIP91_001527 [Steccherinum ochraceum]|uniref:HIT-type domain-containing protein n=1 Tax=Steccherinum ochraceum TaxID=92696 RepID=A0A4V2MXN8_9APHY|nr:hypothetical protein EIP91_001527 [Steccherinum ochraceum]